MPSSSDLNIEASTRLAQANAIVMASRDPQHEALFEELQRNFDDICVLYRVDDFVGEETYVMLIGHIDALYIRFVEMTGGVEALQRINARPRGNSPLRFKLASDLPSPDNSTT